MGFLNRLEITFEEFDTFFQELIDKHLDSNKLKSEQEDMVDVLLRKRTDHNFSFDLTIDHIKAILKVFSFSLKTSIINFTVYVYTILFSFAFPFYAGHVYCWNRHSCGYYDLGHELLDEKPKVFEESSSRSEGFGWGKRVCK